MVVLVYRFVIYLVDIYRFEFFVSWYEIEVYEKLFIKLYLYLNYEKDRKFRKYLLYIEIGRGLFSYFMFLLMLLKVRIYKYGNFLYVILFVI